MTTAIRVRDLTEQQADALVCDMVAPVDCLDLRYRDGLMRQQTMQSMGSGYSAETLRYQAMAQLQAMQLRAQEMGQQYDPLIPPMPPYWSAQP